MTRDVILKVQTSGPCISRICTSDLVRPWHVSIPGSVIDENRGHVVMTSLRHHVTRDVIFKVHHEYILVISQWLKSKRFLHITERNTSVFVLFLGVSHTAKHLSSLCYFFFHFFFFFFFLHFFPHRFTHVFFLQVTFAIISISDRLYTWHTLRWPSQDACRFWSSCWRHPRSRDVTLKVQTLGPRISGTVGPTWFELGMQVFREVL